MANGIDDYWDSIFESEYGGSNPYQSFFNRYLGQDVDVYNPQSIADVLMEQYDVEGLTSDMFTPMDRNLMEASDPTTYDAYKRMQTNPLMRKYSKEVAGGAGILNPNKIRQRAMRQYQMGVSDITQNIYGRTRAASSKVKDWMKSAIDKVFRMKY